VKAAGLLSVINVPGPLTIFAPTDAAFAKLPNATLASLKANPAALAGVLSYHVVDGDVYTANMTDGEALVALNQENLTVTISGSRYFINNVPIVTPDVMACNGVIQVMGGVLIPPTPAPASSPTTPSMTTAPSMPAGSPVMMPTGGSCQTIAQIAEASGNFTTLVELVKAAGLLSVINVPGPLTIFAPTDSAFTKLPNATLASLKANPAALAGVLSYHVVVGDVYTANMTDGETLVALNQENLTVTISGSRYFINNVPIVTPDVMACNGVIQVMGGVMIPPTPAPASSPTTPSMPSMPSGSPVMMPTGGTMGPTTAAAAGGVRVFGIWMAALFAYMVTM